MHFEYKTAAFVTKSYLTIIMFDRHINSDFLQLIANLARGVNGTHAVLRAA